MPVCDRAISYNKVSSYRDEALGASIISIADLIGGARRCG